MPPRRSKGSGSSGPSVPDQHAEWLDLLRPDGPFLALDVLTDVFGQGLDEVPREVGDRVRQAWGEVQEAPDLLLPAWTELILHELLRLPARELSEAATVAGLPARGRPDLVAYGPDPASAPQGRAMRLLLYRLDWDAPLQKGGGDRPSPVEQAAAFCRDTGVPLALVTNGRLWALVHARPAEASSVAVFDADLWLEERSLLRAFVTLLDARRVLAPPRRPDGTWSDGLVALFARSAEAHTKVTDTLGRQVRQAVELLVGEFARLDREASGALLADVPEREIYRGALTVLMRLVFLLYAEEQGLLPTLDDLYTESYAVSTLYDLLEAERDLYTKEGSDRRAAAWPRLLALFHAVYSGSEHPDLRIPAYGGSLFNPQRHAWLARVAVTDRVVHEVLTALILLGGRGKAAERLSYKGLDVEQIGHVYEGLLEFSCLKVSEPYVGFIGKLEPELPLAQVEAEYAKGTSPFQEWLKKKCGLSPARLKKALAATPPDPRQLDDLGAACDNDAELAERIRPFWGLLRLDLRQVPTVFPTGSVLFTQVGDRRATGTHYTPRSLAEEVVKYTLEPLCYRPGPAEGAERSEWQVKPAAELLDLNICDPAMGSGAFLVSAVRFMAERLVEAWYLDTIPDDIAEALGDGYDSDALLLMAKRRVAASCIYGVDRDDMAVELAKLSLWIETLAKDKPFSFLDHALRCGDSLVGLIDEAQVVAFHLDPERGHLINARLESIIDEVAGPILTRVQELREEIEANAADTIERISEKEEKLREAESLTARLRTAADAVAAAALSTAQLPDTEDRDGRTTFDNRLTSIADEIQAIIKADEVESPLEAELRAKLNTWLQGTRKEPIKPLHWSLEFPEVMRRRGFDAVVGNPPFIGGQRLSGALGVDLREHLVRHISGGRRGSADMCSYFYLRNLSIAPCGRVGIIAASAIAEVGTKDVGLAQAIDQGWNIYRAEKSQPWPGTASLNISLVWTGHQGAGEKPTLDGVGVSEITAALDPASRVRVEPHQLFVNTDRSFQGSNVLGKGFFVDPSEARDIMDRDPRAKEVVFPYLGGEDINSRWDYSPLRWVINFRDWGMDRAGQYQDCFEIVEREVKPFRSKNNDRRRRELWWQFTRPTIDLYDRISELQRVLVIARVSSTAMPTLVPTGSVFNEQIIVFVSDRPADLSLLSSNHHLCWAWEYSGRLKADLRYTPSRCYETFPQPVGTVRMERVGVKLDSLRQDFMQRRKMGLTKVYRNVNDSLESCSDIVHLREIHVEIDESVQEAYALDEEREPEIREFEPKIASEPLPSWREIDLGHGFHETRQGVRFTISPQAQYDVLDKLLALNHYRYKQEVERGLHNKKGPKKSGPARRSKPASTEATLDDGLFAPPDALF